MADKIGGKPPFEWMEKFLQNTRKPADYAEKTLAAYRLGIKAGGSIRGVRVQVGEGSCAAAREIPSGAVYHPDDTPHLPLPACSHAGQCPCVYRPVMDYEAEGGG